MITYVEKGLYLHAEIGKKGHSLAQQDGKWISSDEAAVQKIIDEFDPLPHAQAEAKEQVKAASQSARLRYVTDAAGKDTEYSFKAVEAAEYNQSGAVGAFMQARMNLTGETAAEVAAEWNANAAAWTLIGANLAAIEDKFSRDLKAETDWQNCSKLADAAVALIEAI